MRSSKPTLTPQFVLWSDGSARDFDLGWGAVLWRKDESLAQTLSGGTRLKTDPSHGSEVAEWIAATKGLALIHAKKQPVLVLSDSQSVVNFINGVVGNNAVDLDACLARVGSQAFFGLGQEASQFDFLQALKVKGHAGSLGNVLVDELAARGRERLEDAYATTPGAPLAKEMAILLSAGSTAYSVTRKHAVPARITKSEHTDVESKPKQPAPKLTAAQIKSLTHGLTIELTLLEKSKIAARSAELLERAEALPGQKPAQVTKRNLAVHRAKAYGKNATKALLEQKTKEEAAKRVGTA